MAKTKNVYQIIQVLGLLAIQACTAEYSLRLTSVPVPQVSDVPSEPAPGGDPTPVGDPPVGVSPANPANQTPVVCDPFAAGNIIAPEYGLKAELFAIADPNEAWQVFRSKDYQTPGRKIDLEVFVSELNIPSRRWSNGFATEGGQRLKVLKNGVEEDLVEWFGLKFVSSLKFNETGYVQLAVISDDGVTVDVIESGQDYRTLFEVEGFHPPELKVAKRLLDFTTANKKIPIVVNYFQGPRFHISLVLLYRVFSSADDAQLGEKLDEKGHFETEFFWDSSVYPSIPTANYNSLLERGWRPLRAENFLLQEGTNRCFFGNGQ